VHAATKSLTSGANANVELPSLPAYALHLDSRFPISR
jgi:hypothetical protein